MKKEEIEREIRRDYVWIGYALIGLVIAVFAFIYESVLTSDVTLSINVNQGYSGLETAIIGVLFAGMIYLVYRYVIKDLK